MADLTMIGAALVALKQAGETTKSGLEVYKALKTSGKDNELAEVRAVAAELAERLFEARATNLEVQTQLLEFQATAKEQDKYEEILSAYSIVETEAGAQVWQLMDETEEHTLFEFVCPNCVSKRRGFFPLQPDRHKHYLLCHNCGAKIPNTPIKPPAEISGLQIRSGGRKRKG